MRHVILAGGSGTRLWPFSRSSLPKQFLKFGDDETLLQKTILRFYPKTPPQDILIVTNKAYLDIAREQLTALDPAFASQVIVDPEKRNTAPAIALAVKYFQEFLGAGKEECFFVSSADHLVSPVHVLLEALEEGKKIVAQGNHLIFGIRPTKPETGYGYIKTKKGEKGSFLEVEGFEEKPDLAKAQIYLLSGQYLWNAGMFLFQIGAFLEDLERHCPAISALLGGSFEQIYSRFSEMPDISIDYALLEKSKKLRVAPLAISWSDVGSWDSIYDVYDKDSNQNVKIGNVLDVDTEQCLIVGSKRLISTVGLKNMIIVDTEDALFIGKKGESQKIKHLVEQMRKRDVKESSEHLTFINHQILSECGVGLNSD